MTAHTELVQWIRVSTGEEVKGSAIAGVIITQDITMNDLRPYVSWWTHRRLRQRDAAGIPLDSTWWAVQARLHGDGSVIVAAGRTRSWALATKRKFIALVDGHKPGLWMYRKATGQFETRRR